MPKLLQINVTANLASTGRIAEDLGEVVMGEGWDSYIAYGRGCRPSASRLIKVGGNLSIYSHLLYSRLFDRQGFGSYFATKKMLKEIETIKPDIIQFHNIHGYFLNIPLVLKYIRNNNIPLIWSLHDCWSMTGHCAHFALEGCERWKTQCYNCPLKRDYPKSIFIDSSKRNYKEKKSLIEAVPNLTIISGSRWLADIAKKSYFANRKIYVIPDGIDTDIYQPRQEGDIIRKRMGWENKFVIIASGTNWPYYKGLTDFGKLRQILNDDYVIVIIGMKQSEIDNLPEGIIGIPRTKSPQELSEWYSMADCVMSLSRLESFGLTPVEGFACGTPAIVYNCTSTPELITQDTGFVAEEGNILDVKEKVLKLREIGKKEFSKKCRNIAITKYDRGVCYKQYMNLYYSLLK